MRISIEGLPGSGKTTILELLGTIGYDCYHNNNAQIGAQAQKTKTETEVVTEMQCNQLVVVESSSYVLNKLLKSLRKRNKLVRYPVLSSTLATVGPTTHVHHTKSGMEFKSGLESKAKPDCIIFLDCPPDIAIQRAEANNGHASNMTDRTNMTNMTSLQIAELYGHYDWILHPSNCSIPVFRVNSSGSALDTLHHLTEALQVIFREFNIAATAHAVSTNQTGSQAKDGRAYSMGRKVNAWSNNRLMEPSPRCSFKDYRPVPADVENESKLSCSI